MCKFNHRRIAYKCSIAHLLLPSTLTRKLLIIQASYYMITKLRAHITQKCKKLNIHKYGIVLGFADQAYIMCVLCISCNMGRRDLPDMYARSPVAYIQYQENPDCPSDMYPFPNNIKTHNHIDLLHLYKEC